MDESSAEQVTSGEVEGSRSMASPPDEGAVSPPSESPSNLWARLEALWLAAKAGARRWWLFWTLLLIVGAVVLVARSTYQADIVGIPTYVVADEWTPAPTDGGVNYCSRFGSALVRYSGFSRLCAWTTFFLGVLLGGIAVVIGSDDQVPPNAALWQRLWFKHRNVALLLLAGISWVTAYSSFVRVRTASETVQVLTSSISEAEVSRAQRTNFVHVTTRATLSSSLTESQWAESRKRSLTAFNDKLDRELFAKCVSARGTWEVARTRSLEFAESVARGRASDFFDQREKTAKEIESAAGEAQSRKTVATEEVTATKSLKEQLEGLIERSDSSEGELHANSRKLAEAATSAARAAAQVELATSKVANLTAGIDTSLAASLQPRVAELRLKVDEANQAAAKAAQAAKAPAPTNANAAAKAVAAEAEKAVNAASQALEVATTVTDTVQIAAASQPILPPN